jgi:hypothetical protein
MFALFSLLNVSISAVQERPQNEKSALRKQTFLQTGWMS